MPYNSFRGGHAPNDLRDEFLETIERLTKGYTYNTETDAFYAVAVPRLYVLARHLWNCSDIIPGGLEGAFDRLGCLYDGSGIGCSGSTYARAARVLRAYLEQEYPDLHRTRIAGAA